MKKLLFLLVMLLASNVFAQGSDFAEVEQLFKNTADLARMKEESFGKLCTSYSFSVADKMINEQFPGSSASCKDKSGTLIINTEKYKFAKGRVVNISKIQDNIQFEMGLDKGAAQFMKYSNATDNESVTIVKSGSTKFIIDSVSSKSMNDELHKKGISLSNKQLGDKFTLLLKKLNQQNDVTIFAQTFVNFDTRKMLVDTITNYIVSGK